MKKEYFNIDDYGKIYKNIDYLNPNDLDMINGDNIFLAFLKDNPSLNYITSIDGKIYNFSTHKYITDEILYAKAFSDFVPKEIWRLIYIINYNIITIDIDDDKIYLFEEFEEKYKGSYDKNAKKNVLKNGYITPKLMKKSILTKDNLKNITDENIFLAILENVNCDSSFERENLISITYEGIEDLTILLEDMIDSRKIILPKGNKKDEFVNEFKNQAIDELDKYWYFRINENQTIANFITSINGNIFNLCTNEYINNSIEINYVKPLKSILPKNKWQLSYSKSGALNCIVIDEDYLDVLVAFECEHKDDIDKFAKSKVLRNGYQINIGVNHE